MGLFFSNLKGISILFAIVGNFDRRLFAINHRGMF